MGAIHVFIFRRDLRVHDNLAWNKLMKDHVKPNDKVLPVFIFNDTQVDPKKNKYYSRNCVEFMTQCLHSLDEDLNGNLHMFHTNKSDIQVLDRLLSEFPSITTVASNADFTPFAIKRDDEINRWCVKHKLTYLEAEDYTLLPINTVLNNKHTFFSVYTPFYRRFLQQLDGVVKPSTADFDVNSLVKNKQSDNSVDATSKYYGGVRNPNLFVQGGRRHALGIISKIKKGDFKDYDTRRDIPSLDGTTRLSAYLKFGCVSVREVFAAVLEAYGKDHGLIRELIWREFYANITFNKPRILAGQVGSNRSHENLPFKEKYDGLKWSMTGQQKEWFKAWCEGTTSFPIVDAAMRQLNTTGWMHNRCRMIVASFLIKDLLIDWRIGEKYFATKLVDYDPSSNNGGWQFCSSTGVDAQPYFRIFNPFSQSTKFDPDALYIKRWVPELQDVNPHDIHKWDDEKVRGKYVTTANAYGAPIVEHKKQAKLALELYKSVS